MIGIYINYRLKEPTLLSWRDEEGWFEEYSGLDIGYESLTFSCLVQLQEVLDKGYKS